MRSGFTIWDSILAQKGSKIESSARTEWPNTGDMDDVACRSLVGLRRDMASQSFSEFDLETPKN